ncbi:MAG: class I SAM-dependent methyltransferase [Alphaproteobacteria bacterium]|nr:class I SAM-dependent methyltransferase [Rhodospirillaceae bacterium]MBT6203599.1 class I SAM-dependent methyltransferase [Rhodospirillaceae bacterium]MBT6512804.1 class I SAM-dependent methyltransferase [Rhodospirillaceae bacterium]MBT7645529.1 class I SAM-dependent methyltransferase [Rhodospirillaceae bacterium]MDG2482868.1 class I SAM-dependent methyltransferase [Alphaproteobacteria bacterium]
MIDRPGIAKIYHAQSLDEVRQAYDTWAETYDVQVVDEFGFRAYEYVVASVRAHLDDDAHLLDAGSGSGMVGLAAQAAGLTTIDAMDLSVGMLEKAKARGIYRDVRVGVLGEPLDYLTDSYDAVLSAGVFTPGHAPPEAFVELVRVVKPGGLICFTLCDDVTPLGFIEEMERLASQGTWELITMGEPFQSMPNGQPEIELRIWLYRVL